MAEGQILQVATIEDNQLIFDHAKFSTILERIGNRKFCVVSLNGRTRCGKSFMGSQFLKYLYSRSRGKLNNWTLQNNHVSFPWDTNADRMTNGIQVWSEPAFLLQDNEEIAVLLLDAQGLFDHETSDQQNALLFTLSCLLSSNFIFNDSVSSEDVFDFLHAFLEYSKIMTDSDATRGNLLFLRRDWENDDEYALGYHSSKEMPSGSVGNLKKLLFDVQLGQSEQSMATRRGVSISRDIGVYALPPPVVIPDPNIPAAYWDFTFRLEVVKFVEWIFSDSQIASNLKQIRGEKVTGQQMKTFVTAWGNILNNSNGLPNLQSLQTATTNQIGVKLITEGLDWFNSEIKSVLNGFSNGYPSAPFETLCTQNVTQVLARFDESKSLGSSKAQFRQRLLSEIASARDTFKQQNDAKLQLAAEVAAAAHTAEVERLKRLQAEADARAAAAAAEVASQQQVVAEAQRLQQKQAKITAAEAEVIRANDAANAAAANLRSVQANTAAFDYSVTISTKHRNRGPFGVVLSPSYIYHNETRFNAEAYNQAVNIAQQAAQTEQASLANATANLSAARNS